MRIRSKSFLFSAMMLSLALVPAAAFAGFQMSPGSEDSSPVESGQMNAGEMNAGHMGPIQMKSVAQSTVVRPVAAATVAAQTISPKSVYVHMGQEQQFVSPGATSWTSSNGKIDSTGMYVTPSSLPAVTTVTVTAKGPGGSATATVVLVAGPLQSVSPSQVTLALGGKQVFTSPQGSSWSALYGTITSAGVYTAPTAWPAIGEDKITVLGAHGSATAMIALIPPAPKVTAAGAGGTFPLGLFSCYVAGTGLIPQSVVKINGVKFSSTYSAGLLQVQGFVFSPGAATLTVTNGQTTSNAFPIFIGSKNPVVSPAAARRFLEQAAFGPSPTDALTVQNYGFKGWLNLQMSAAPYSNYNAVTATYGGMPEQFLANAVHNPDQLRQRVAFALSQIFVTSLEKLSNNSNMISFQNMLLTQAFGNYRQIMLLVTIHPAMGQYLDMANNAKGNPATGAEANQNFAREQMQLFSLGTNLLNQDGSVKLDANGLPIPTYTQTDIEQFSKVYTGWTYAPHPGSAVQWNEPISSYGYMVPVSDQHDFSSKQLLLGHVAPAGLSPSTDLEQALDNIFNHPNCPPFVSKLLIQHLVKSNPSPAYISRVAAVFTDNGSKVRGDMKAVIQAILLDPEARANDAGGEDQQTDGHLQEPALFIAGMVRAFGGSMGTNNYYHYELANMGQDIFSSPSVFNYYSESSGAPGTALQGGEFQIYSPNNAIERANEVTWLFSQWSNPVQTFGPGTSVDLSAFISLAPSPASLVAALDLTLTHGTMPREMKLDIVNAVTAETGGSLRRVQRAIYLILTSGYYNVWH